MHAAVCAAWNKVTLVWRLRKADADLIISMIVSGARECPHEKNSYRLFFKFCTKPIPKFILYFR